MDTHVVIQDFRAKVCEQISLQEEGLNRFRVFSPFRFEDGDHLSIVLLHSANGWRLSDEGHTYMHLSYELDSADLQRGNRQTIISNVLSMYGVEEDDGELFVNVPGESFGDALYSFAQALLKISDVTFLSREMVRSTFLTDFKSFLEHAVDEGRRTFEWHDPVRDKEMKYPVDCRINGMEKPLLIFALPSDDRVRDATITLLKFEQWNLQYKSVAIFEDQERINRKVLARLTDVCDKQFSSLDAEERIQKYLAENIR